MNASILHNPECGFSVDDIVIFKVEITVYGDLEPAIGNAIEMTSNDRTGSLDCCMKKLLFDSISADVDFIVGNMEVHIPAHRCILMARSPMFHAMFSAHMCEASSGKIFVPDFDADTIQEMLHFLYTDRLSDTEVLRAKADALLFIALKYQILALITLCEAHFISQLSDTTVMDILNLAEDACDFCLKEKAIQYIVQNQSSVLQMKEFSQLPQGLITEVQSAIDSMEKRKGCRGIVEKERRFNSTCSIM
jgi:hypothetical protein